MFSAEDFKTIQVVPYPLGSGRGDVRLPGQGNSNSHGARPVHLIITMIKWIRTSRLSVKNSLSEGLELTQRFAVLRRFRETAPRSLRTVLNLRTTTSQKCESVPKRARI